MAKWFEISFSSKLRPHYDSCCGYHKFDYFNAHKMTEIVGTRSTENSVVSNWIVYIYCNSHGYSIMIRVSCYSLSNDIAFIRLIRSILVCFSAILHRVKHYSHLTCTHFNNVFNYRPFCFARQAFMRQTTNDTLPH